VPGRLGVFNIAGLSFELRPLDIQKMPELISLAALPALSKEKAAHFGYAEYGKRKQDQPEGRVFHRVLTAVVYAGHDGRVRIQEGRLCEEQQVPVDLPM